MYLASTGGRNGWQGDAGVVTWIDRGDWRKAGETARRWAAEAEASGDTVELLRARAAEASVASLGGGGNDAAARRVLLESAGKWGAEADAAFPPTSTEVRLYAGLLAAHAGDRAGVDAALEATRASPILRDYPTVAQLQQVLLAEQSRLDGKPQAAVERLAPLARQETGLVAVHWALMRAAAASGNPATAAAEARWLATRRGRVFAEGTTTDVLRFFNIAVSRQAIDDAREPGVASSR